jgi:hypothetical protein
MTNESLQRAYVSFLQHGGGQAVFLQPHQPHMYFCTHVVHDTNPTVTTSSTAQSETKTRFCQKYASSTTDHFSLRLLHVFRFLVCVPLLSSSRGQTKLSEDYESMYRTWLQRPSHEKDLLPLEVSSAWVEECLRRRERVSEQPYLLCPPPSYTICNLAEDWRDQITEAGGIYVPANDTHGRLTRPLSAHVRTLSDECELGHHEQFYLKHISLCKGKQGTVLNEFYIDLCCLHYQFIIKST